MVSVHYDRENVDLTVQGHAGYAEPGKDIVCSAVTILTATLALLLYPYSAEECFDAELGMFHARVPDDSFPKENFIPYFDFVVEGLRLLSNTYPQNVIIIEGSDRHGESKQAG